MEVLYLSIKTSLHALSLNLKGREKPQPLAERVSVLALICKHWVIRKKIDGSKHCYPVRSFATLYSTCKVRAHKLDRQEVPSGKFELKYKMKCYGHTEIGAMLSCTELFCCCRQLGLLVEDVPMWLNQAPQEYRNAVICQLKWSLST